MERREEKEGGMIRTGTLTLLAGLVAAAAAPAQTAHFHWQPGRVLTYTVSQVTTASEVVEGTKVETTNKLEETKRWQVLAVDAAGVATLQLSLTALRVETTTPRGDVLLFDSAQPDKSDAQLREQMGRYVGQPLAVLRVDGLGKVVEVKECKYGPASRFESEPPFVITLPGDGLKSGQNWARSYQVTLEPPQGTGEKYQAAQKYVCQSVAAGAATLALTTVLDTQPEALADRVPLLQVQPEGEVVFDTQLGLLRSARLHIDKELKGHQGENSSYHFQSSYSEQYTSNP
jgi:hypothetical protein